MAVDDNSKVMLKKVVFKADVEKGDDQVEGDADEKLTKFIAFLAKNFSNVMRRLDKRLRNNVTTNIKNNQHHNLKGVNF